MSKIKWTPESQPKDHGVKSWMGLPMRWNAQQMFLDVWYPNDERVFPPKQFGIGWGFNFHAFLRGIGLIKNQRKSKK